MQCSELVLMNTNQTEMGLRYESPTHYYIKTFHEPVLDRNLMTLLTANVRMNKNDLKCY